MNVTPEILDECMSAILAGATVQEALAAYPELKEELEPLLLLGAGLSSAPDPLLDPAVMLENMGRAMATAPVPKRRSRAAVFSRPVFTRLAASLAMVFALGWGATVVSAPAVPGDWLYPLKLMTERVRFALAVNSENKAELRIAFSERRLVEAVKKYDAGQGLDPRLLKEMLDEASAALESVANLPASSRDIMAARVLSATRFQEENLKRLHARVTPQEQEIIQPYLDMCSKRCDWMQKNMDSTEGWTECGTAGDRDCPW